MNKHQKLLEKILRGGSDANIAFHDLVGLLHQLGFEERIRGGHHTFRRAGIVEKPNIQCDGNKAKSYQVRQIRELILRYGLRVE